MEETNMKKIICLVLSLVLTMSLLTGCGGGENDSYGADGNDSVSNDGTGAASFDGAISVISREDGSGTRGAFVELFGVEEKDADGNKVDRTTLDAIITNSTSVMMTSVSGNEQAIGYISLGSLDDTVVKAIQIDGVDATAENIKNGTYAISRPFNIATKDGLSEVATDFINYIMSAEGQAIIEENGYIAIKDDAAAYAGTAPAGKVVIAGSSSVTPVMQKLKEAYVAVNTNAEIEIQESDSSTGMTSTIDGLCDIGMASRELKDSELEAGLTSTAIAMDGIAVIVNLNSPINNLTAEQVKSIYVGETLTWGEVQ